MLDSISGRHYVAHRGGLVAVAALFAATWLSACGSQQASSTASPASASSAPTQAAVSKEKAPGVAALTGVPANCAAGASEAVVSDGVGKPVKLVGEQPVTDALTCWYSLNGQSLGGGVGPISLIYNKMTKVPTQDDFNSLVASFHSSTQATTLEMIQGLGDYAVWLVLNLPGYGTVWQVAASKGAFLVAFSVSSPAGTQGDRSKMAALVRALLG